MKKTLWCSLGLFLGVFLGGSQVRAEMMPIKPGTVRTYASDNGKYVVTVTYGNGGMATWSLKEDGKELWSDALMEMPSHVTISDNGETLLAPTWGWQDEGGANGVAIYDKKGQKVREIPFKSGNPPQETLRWIKVRAISPDGKYFAIAGNSNEKGACLTLLDVSTGVILWEKNLGYPEAAEIKIASGGEYVLFSTYENEKWGMKFVLLDRAGQVLREKMLENNYANNVGRYSGFTENNSKFEVFDKKSGAFLSEDVK